MMLQAATATVIIQLITALIVMTPNNNYMPPNVSTDSYVFAHTAAQASNLPLRNRQATEKAIKKA